MKPIDIKSSSCAEYNVEYNEKNPKFTVGDHVKISKYKNIFAEEYPPNWSEEAFLISNMNNTVPGTYVINDLNGKEGVGTFYEKNCRRKIKKTLEYKKLLKEKKSYLSNEKAMAIHLIVRFIKQTLHNMSQYFPKPCRNFGRNIKIKVYLSNYVTKLDLKNVTGLDTLN